MKVRQVLLKKTSFLILVLENQNLHSFKGKTIKNCYKNTEIKRKVIKSFKSNIKGNHLIFCAKPSG